MARIKPTGWVGWVYFASMLLLLLGALQAITGVVALTKSEYFEVAQSELLAFDFTVWGWISVALGALVIASGVLILLGNAWGGISGAFLAVLTAVAALVFMAAAPAWSVIAIILSVIVIYSLTMNGYKAKR